MLEAWPPILRWLEKAVDVAAVKDSRWALALADFHMRQGRPGPALEAYSVQLSPQATLNLNSLLKQSLGAKTTVSVASATAFGAEDDVDASQIVGNATLLAALFALTATPEAENHGAFVDRLRGAAPAHRLVALVDESAFRRQFGATPRLEERRALWRGFAAERGVPVAFLDLEKPDPGAVRLLQDALQAPPGR